MGNIANISQNDKPQAGDVLISSFLPSTGGWGWTKTVQFKQSGRGVCSLRQIILHDYNNTSNEKQVKQFQHGVRIGFFSAIWPLFYLYIFKEGIVGFNLLNASFFFHFCKSCKRQLISFSGYKIFLVFYVYNILYLCMSGSLQVPWTVAFQPPLSMGLSQQAYWSGLPFPPPGDPEDPGRLQSMGWQRFGHDLVTKQQQQQLSTKPTSL